MKEKFFAASARCRRPSCPRPVYSRGLCSSCYSMAAQLVRDKVTSWDDLRKNGKVAEPVRTAKEWLLSV